jgi:hypothetical protein
LDFGGESDDDEKQQLFDHDHDLIEFMVQPGELPTITETLKRDIFGDTESEMPQIIKKNAKKRFEKEKFCKRYAENKFWHPSLILAPF